MKMTRPHIGCVFEKPAQGMGLFVLRRPNLLADQMYSFELWLDGYQSYCLRHWLELRWKTPCLQNSRVIRDSSTGDSVIVLTLPAPSESAAKLKFDAWVQQLISANESVNQERR